MRNSALLVLVSLALASAACSGSEPDAGGEAEQTPPLASSPQAGEAAGPARPQAFVQCITCHQIEPGRHGLGPSLAGVFGAKAGHAQGYAYSAAMKNSGLTWDEAALNAYLEAPMQAVPGTKMAFAGIKDAQQRQDVIQYLKGL